MLSFFYLSHCLSRVGLWPSSSISTGCVVPLRGDWAVFCRVGSGRVGRVWSAREKSLLILHHGRELNPATERTDSKPLGGFACSRPKFLEKFRSNFNSSVRAERSFTIRYLNVVTKPLCGNLDVCLNYYFRSWNSVRVLSVADRDRKRKMLFWIALFGRALAQFSRFRDRNPFRSQKTRAHGCTYYVILWRSNSLYCTTR